MNRFVIIIIISILANLMMFGLYRGHPQTRRSMKCLHSSDTERHRFKLAVSSLAGQSDGTRIVLIPTWEKHSGGKSRGPRRRDWSSGPSLWRTKRGPGSAGDCCHSPELSETGSHTGRLPTVMTWLTDWLGGPWCNNDLQAAADSRQQTYHLITARLITS